jgi:hypothetical protein
VNESRINMMILRFRGLRKLRQSVVNKQLLHGVTSQ